MNNKLNIIIAGHGGQGVRLIAQLLSEYFYDEGLHVKSTSLIGLGIKGGGIYSIVKCGGEVISPLIMPGECDLIIGLEKLECLRWIDYLKPKGTIVLNDLYIQPSTVSSGLEVGMKEDIDVLLKDNCSTLLMCNGEKEVDELTPKTVVNAFFLGIVAKALKHDLLRWEEILKSKIPQKYIESNQKAFRKAVRWYEREVY